MDKRTLDVQLTRLQAITTLLLSAYLESA